MSTNLCSRCMEIPFGDLLAPEQDSKRQRGYLIGRYGEIYGSSLECELCGRIAKFLSHDIEDDNPMIFLDVSDMPSITIWTGEGAPETRRFTQEAWYITAMIDDEEVESQVRLVSQTWSTTIEKIPRGFDYIQRWQRLCDEGHDQCRSSINLKVSSVPKRLLDVGDALEGAGPDLHPNMAFSSSFLDYPIKLVITADVQPAIESYTILSYCWGRAQPLITTKANLDSQKKGILARNFPKTIREAVFVTRQLGMRYLWVDALCIIQDDSLDWHEEAAKMGDYYSNAYLTIAASAAVDSSEGCFVERKESSILEMDISEPNQNRRLYMSVVPLPAGPGGAGSIMYDDTWHDPLTRRAWTLQERILSGRSLLFSTKGPIWECETTMQRAKHSPSQGFNTGALTQDTGSGLDLSIDDWRTIVRSYSTRNISYASDKLPALAGLISVLENRYQDRCYAGVWEKGYHGSLCWIVDKTAFSPKQAAYPEEWRAPSWSFLAIEAPIAYHFFTAGHKRIAEVQKWHLQPVEGSSNIHGQLRAGHLLIKAPLFTLSVAPTYTDGIYEASFVTTSGRLAFITLDYDTDPVYPCSLLVILDEAALIVIPASEDDSYRRIGVASLTYDDGIDERGLPKGRSIGFLDVDIPGPSMVKLV